MTVPASKIRPDPNGGVSTATHDVGFRLMRSFGQMARLKPDAVVEDLLTL